MESNQGQPEGADEAAVLPSDTWLLNDFDMLLDNNLVNLSYDTPRLDEPLVDPLYAEFDPGNMGFPENNLGYMEVTDTFPEPLADPYSAAGGAGDMALPQHDSGEILSTFTFSDQMISGFLADTGSATCPVPNPIVSTSSNAFLPQAHVPGLALPAVSAGDNSRSLITSASSVIQSSGPAIWKYTSHQGQNPHLYPLVIPLANCSIDNRAIDPSIQLGTCPAPGFLQGQPAATIQTVLLPFEGPQPFATLHPPDSSTPAPVMPQLVTSSAPHVIGHPQPAFKEIPYRPIAPKETCPRSSSQALAVQRSLPPPPGRAPGQSSNLKRKRRLSSHEPFGQICFSVIQSIEATGDSKKRPKGLKYSKDACLRCKVSRKKCSGTYPCENCLNATKPTLKIQECFDSEVTNLNGFSTLSDLFSFPGIKPTMSIPQHKPGTPEWEAGMSRLFNPLIRVSWLFKSMVTHTMVPAGLVKFLLQGPHGISGVRILDDGGSIALHRFHGSSYSPQCRPSFYWTLAVIHCHPEVVAQMIGVSGHELWTLKEILSRHVFERVSYLIRRFRSKSYNMKLKHRHELLEGLQTIQFVPYSNIFMKNTFGFIENHILPGVRGKNIGPKGEMFQEPNMEAVAKKFLEQQTQLFLLSHYWTRKLYTGPSFQGYGICLFSLVVLSRIDWSQKPRPEEDPIDQATEFLSELGCDPSYINALQWEKQNQSLGALGTFWDYVAKLDALKESMAASQQAATSSHTPPQQNEP